MSDADGLSLGKADHPLPRRKWLVVLSALISVAMLATPRGLPARASLSVAPGRLDLHGTDTIEGQGTGGYVRSVTARDHNGDGYPEVILTFSAPPPSSTALPAMVVEASGPMRVATGD